MESEHTYLFDLKLEKEIRWANLVSEMDKELLKNEWIHVELQLENLWNFNLSETEIKILKSVQMGIHVWKENSNTEEDVIFTNPYKKRKINEYPIASQKKKKQKRFSIGLNFQRNMWVHHNFRARLRKQKKRSTKLDSLN